MPVSLHACIDRRGFVFLKKNQRSAFKGQANHVLNRERQTGNVENLMSGRLGRPDLKSQEEYSNFLVRLNRDNGTKL